MCNGDSLVTCSSVTSVLKPCHLLLSALHPVHVALLWKLQLLFFLWCLILEPFLHEYLKTIFNTEELLSLLSFGVIQMEFLCMVSVSLFLKILGCLIASMFYLFNSWKAPKDTESNTVFAVLLVLVPLFGWERYS